MPKVTAEEINAFLQGHFPGTGNRCEELGDGWATALFKVDPSNLRPGGIVSGPTVFGVCDAALYYACFTLIGLEPMTLTSELSIRFLRPAFGEEVRARATIDHCGKRSIIGTITAWTTDPAKPCAVAQGTYVRPAGG